MKAPSCKYSQLEPTEGFHELNWASAIFALFAMSQQVSPETTLWNVLQLPTIPGCIGVGVATPFPLVVVLVFNVVLVGAV